jgi:hypothetical protein
MDGPLKEFPAINLFDPLPELLIQRSGKFSRLSSGSPIAIRPIGAHLQIRPLGPISLDLLSEPLHPLPVFLRSAPLPLGFDVRPQISPGDPHYPTEQIIDHP